MMIIIVFFFQYKDKWNYFDEFGYIYRYYKIPVQLLRGIHDSFTYNLEYTSIV